MIKRRGLGLIRPLERGEAPQLRAAVDDESRWSGRGNKDRVGFSKRSSSSRPRRGLQFCPTQSAAPRSSTTQHKMSIKPVTKQSKTSTAAQAVKEASIDDLLQKKARASGRLHVVGLFAGIGGVELGLRRAGHEADLLCEIDDGAAAVLATRFRGVELARDVRSVKRLPRGTQLLAAGFPCQDLSQAGKTAGIGGRNSGLIDEVFRLVEGQEVPWVLLENVPFMLRLGRGRAMTHIVETFEKLGYRWAYRIVDSRAFGLPQRRERVIFLASKEADPRRVLLVDDAGIADAGSSARNGNRPACGFYWTEGNRGLGWAEDCVPTLKGGSTVGIPSPPAIWMPSGEIVRPDIRDAERLQGFDANWTKPAERVVRPSFRWKLVGNAVTVDVAHWVGVRLGAPGLRYDESKDREIHESSAWPDAAWNVSGVRFASMASRWPLRVRAAPLAEFLEYPIEMLSARATLGFYLRFKESSLRKPEGFMVALERHLKRMDPKDAHQATAS